MTHLISILAALAVPQAQAQELPPTLRPDYVQMADSADWYIAREMWPDAKRCTEEALRCDPANFNNAMLFSNLGIINLHLGLHDEAVSNFTLGLSIAPASTTLRSNRARAYLEAGDYALAMTDLQELTRADASNQWAWKMYGVTLMALGKRDEAMQAFAHIDDPDADTLRMLAYDALSRNDMTAARGYYDRMLEASPTEEAWFDHAWFLILSSELDEAKEDIRQGLKLYPRSGSLVLLRAYIHRLLHENSMAEMDVRLAKEYDVDNELVETLFPPKRKKK